MALEELGALRSPVLERLEEIHRRYRSIDQGEVATYIPELARADRSQFAICLATADGQLYEVGDTRHRFTLQSISKPFTYGAALAARGRAATLARVGVEPSGDAFNAISLDPVTGRPANPMINAGAITACGLLPGDTSAIRLERLMQTYGQFAGRALEVDEAVFASERDTGFRNRAIGYLLRNAGILEEDPTAIVDLYFRQCSVLVDCRDLAVMAATLAGGGVNPLTGVRALDVENVENVLSVMASCGMYDFSGAWTCEVGLPAKSGVSGGILAVLPGQLGVGIYSPALDLHGNSVRGIAVCRELSQEWGLHLFAGAQGAAGRPAREVIHRSYSAAEVSSRRERSLEARRRLEEIGGAARVYELQGGLAFGTAEAVVRDVLARAAAGVEIVILDLSRVVHLSATAADLLGALALRLTEAGKRLLFAHHKLDLLDQLRADTLTFPDVDRALEWCEDDLLAPWGTEPVSGEGKWEGRDEAVPLEAFALLRGLNETELATVGALLRRVVYRTGERIVRAGDPADCLYLVARGEVTVVLPLPSGYEKRLATFPAGMSFGEMAFLEGSTRSATLYADRDTECWVLDREELERVAGAAPRIKATLMENLARTLCQRLRATNSALGALAE